MYVKYLPENLLQISHYFLIANVIHCSSNNLNDVLSYVKEKTFSDYKMTLKNDSIKKSQEVILWRKSQKQNHPTLYPNNSVVKQMTSQKTSWDASRHQIGIPRSFEERIK